MAHVDKLPLPPGWEEPLADDIGEDNREDTVFSFATEGMDSDQQFAEVARRALRLRPRLTFELMRELVLQFLGRFLWR